MARWRVCTSALLLALALTAAPATAQPEDAVIAAFQNYQRALQAGDMPAAAAAAEAALAAGDAHNLSNGELAALAANLANARLVMDQRDAALAPAQRARDLANGEGGVTPALAELLVFQARFDQDPTASAALLAALTQMADGGVKSQIAFGAAIDLGRWRYAREEYEAAQAPYALALDFIEGDSLGSHLARANALTGLGVALMSSSAIRAPVRTQAETGMRILTQPNLRPEIAAWQSLSEAMDVVYPHLTLRRADGAITPPQEAYAEATAWRTALRSSMSSRNITPPQAPSGQFHLGGRNMCALNVVTEPQPQYPANLRNRGRVGAVVLRIVTRADGSVSSMDIAATAGGDEFAQAVARVAPRWRVERSETASPDCSLETTAFVPVGFVIR